MGTQHSILFTDKLLAAWVGGDVNALVKSDWKPSSERFGTLRWNGSGVSIEWLGGERCFNPHFVEFKNVPKGEKTTRTFPESKTEAVAATAARLAELGPVLIFAGQARWVPSMAKAVLLAFGSNAPAHPWPETEWGIFEAVCKEELGDGSFELGAARVGVICHSDSLPPQVRISIEKLMAKCAPRVIIATTTLGQGVNIGISSVIVATTSVGQKQVISKRDFWNICGRAGRAFVDGEGKVLFAMDMTGKPWQVNKAEIAAKSYFDLANLDQVNSGLLQIVRYLYKLATKAGITFEAFLELVANDVFDHCGPEKAKVEGLVDWIDDQLLALHVLHRGDDLASIVDWVDDAFRDSLAAIQEKNRNELGHDDQLISFLKARTAGVLHRVPQPDARRAIIASGLPLSVGIVAFNQLDGFRDMVDRYLSADIDEAPLCALVLEFEKWARGNARAIVKEMPTQEQLDKIRPQWLGGVSLRKIIEMCGDDSIDICTKLYGYQLPWLFHSVAQKLDKLTEENRVEALSRVGLLVEIGLPMEAAAKVFLAGVRSRAAAMELSRFVIDPTASVSHIRKALLDSASVTALSGAVSASTLEWLHLLSAEHSTSEVAPPQCAKFTLDVSDGVDTLHVRQLQPEGSLWLCSTDMKFKYGVLPTGEMPFDKFADDPRYIFSRDGDEWVQKCRDPRLQAFI